VTERSFAEIDPASDWCQRWNNQQHSWRHKSEGGFDRDRYTVDLIDRETPAKEFVLEHHYSDTYPSAKWRFGLYEHGDLVGVAVFSSPTNVKVLTNVFPELRAYYESTELGRFVLLDAVPANSETFFLARCFEQLAAFGVHGIVSMSDPVQRRIGHRVVFAGHVGTIYQASNALYTGRAWSEPVDMLPSGEILNRRAQQKVRRQDSGHEYVERKLISFGARPLRAGEKPNLWLREAKQAVGIRRVPHAGNHRYAFCLGNKTQRRHILVAPAQSPYPKAVDHAA
jgi:hypothetical protein